MPPVRDDFSQMIQRVFITTLTPAPSFLVHAHVRDKFIDEKVKELFGTQGSETPHEWEAYDEDERCEQKQTQECTPATG